MSVGAMISQERSTNVDVDLHLTRSTGQDAGVLRSQYFDRQETTSFRSGSELSFDQEARSFTQVYQLAKKAPSSSYDTGHEFSTYRKKLLRTTHFSAIPLQNDRTGDRFIGTGSVCIGRFGVNSDGYGSGDLSSVAHIPPLTQNEINVYGAQAIGATSPTAPQAGVTQMLGELKRDGLPSLPGLNSIDGRLRPSALGSDFLNYQFGILPLMSDVKKLLTSMQNASKLIQQYQRDSGRIVRRSFSFPAEQWDTADTYPRPALDLRIPNLSGFEKRPPNGESLDLQVTTRYKRKVYFKGAYTYYLDAGDSLVSKVKGFEQRANYLLGIRLTPDVLWDLAPWSWFADWFGTIGLVLSNVSALQSDGLVIRYGYLMCHTVATRTVEGATGLVGHDDTFHISTTCRSERKDRYKATPYGFGLNVADFDLRKWAILGALGMTLAPGKMR